MSIIGENIKAAREKAGLNQSQLAQMANITKAAISRYESGLREPRVEHLKAIANALNVTPTFLIGYDETLNAEQHNSALDVYHDYTIYQDEKTLLSAFSKLNYEGQQKAIERIQELTEIQKYQAIKEEISKFPDEALPVIAEYIQDVAKDPERYLKQSETERQEQILEFTEKIAKAIKDAE